MVSGIAFFSTQANTNMIEFHITKTWLYNVDPLKHHFYIHVVKLGFTWVYIFFFIFLFKNIDCGYLLEPPLGGSNEYPQSMF